MTTRHKETEKRLLRYALTAKRTIIVALLLLTFAVAAELTGPFIAKHMIDHHIMGIEQEWVPTDGDGVAFNGQTYERGDRVSSINNEEGITILQIDRSYVAMEGTLAFDGEREWAIDQLVVTRGDQVATYNATPMTASDVYAFFEGELPYVLLLMSGYFLLIVFASVLHYFQAYWLEKSANRIILRMRNDVFRKTHELPISYFDQVGAGKIVSRITNDTEAIRELYVRVLATFFSSVVYLIGIFIALFILDYRLALATLIIVPIIIVWMIVYRKYASAYNHVIREKISDINGRINENIQGMPIIQAFGRQKEVQEEFETINETHYRFNRKLLTLNSLTGFNLLNLIRSICFVALIWYFGGASLGIGSVISLGVLYAFVDYINRMFDPVNGIVNQLSLLEEARVAGDRVFYLLDEAGTPVLFEKERKLSGEVHFDNVSFAYKGDTYVLHDISFKVNKGETAAFVGATGSGKSSIMNVLFRFYDHQRGTVKIDGQDIHDMSRQELRENMAIVLQDPFIFTGTIASNIRMDNEQITDAEILDALEKVGAKPLIDRLPNGIHEEINEKGSMLSSGERQLLSFARALAAKPAILMLDEATANVDTETEAIIQHALDVVKAGRTTLVIAHRLSTIREADHIFVLDKGHIVEKGTHEELMEQKGKYHHMYMLQQKGSKKVG
ncbi:ABC transporter ATP-binding protein [Paenalkalicoccus suaedae]|uniref:ABC transporter ATP-binding protein n=1 Tax=Paenalkalicoccus suaedae TaxID=2592382 RepID=A0A859FCZ8_9BACI|nr:ABC transporter ATP-binding protein [Paenalkalicoccus suaedae]QKS70718.1 ABC transporter ATP-binding protein [Paenalkalicoccus suaedae]